MATLEQIARPQAVFIREQLAPVRDLIAASTMNTAKIADVVRLQRIDVTRIGVDPAAAEHRWRGGLDTPSRHRLRSGRLLPRRCSDQAAWEGLMETLRILSDPATAAEFRRGIAEADAGQYVEHDLDEVDE